MQKSIFTKVVFIIFSFFLLLSSYSILAKGKNDVLVQVKYLNKQIVDIKNRYKNFISSNPKINNNYSVLDIEEFLPLVSFGKVIKKKRLGTYDCTGETVYKVYFQYGVSLGKDEFAIGSFVARTDVQIKGGISKSVLKSILGTPYRENNYFITYAVKNPVEEYGGKKHVEYIRCFFKNGKLFSIWTIYEIIC